jgi:hypothetical protein
MEIRRMETELIPPTPVSERTARVDPDHRPPERQSEKHERPADEEPADADESLAIPVRVYDQDGHVREHDITHSEPHNLDLLA